MKLLILIVVVGAFGIWEYEKKHTKTQIVYLNVPTIGSVVAPPPIVVGDPGTLSPPV